MRFAQDAAVRDGIRVGVRADEVDAGDQDDVVFDSGGGGEGFGLARGVCVNGWVVEELPGVVGGCGVCEAGFEFLFAALDCFPVLLALPDEGFQGGWETGECLRSEQDPHVGDVEELLDDVVDGAFAVGFLVVGGHGEEDSPGVSLLYWIDSCFLAQDFAQSAFFVQEIRWLEDKLVYKACEDAKNDGGSHSPCCGCV